MNTKFKKFWSLILISAFSSLCGAGRAEVVSGFIENFDNAPAGWQQQGSQSQFVWQQDGYVAVTMWRSNETTRFFRNLGNTFTSSNEVWWGADFKVNEDVSCSFKRGYFGLLKSDGNNASNLIGNFYWDQYETDLPRHMGTLHRDDSSTVYFGKVMLAGDKCYRYRGHYWKDSDGNGWAEAKFYKILADGSTGRLSASHGPVKVISPGQDFAVDSIGFANLFASDTNTDLKQLAYFDNVIFTTTEPAQMVSVPSFAKTSDLSTDPAKRKIIVDFNGLKKTREFDGSRDGWSYFGQSSGPYVADEYTYFNYTRSDLLDENGNHQIASMWHPLIGMQSCYDEDFIEYQILLAKCAHVDGFSVEWGFPEHESNDLVLAMQEAALKYDFKLMVTWCPNWQLQWLKYYRDFTCPIEETYLESYERLLAEIYTHPTAMTWDGHPLILWFYGGATVDYNIDQYVTQAGAQIPEGMKEPWVFGRDELLSENGFKSTFMWAPPRPYHGGVQDVTGYYIYWDYIGIIQDIMPWMDEAINQSTTPVMASVFPGMDNRPSAGWGGKLKYFHHNFGETQREMWRWIVDNRDDVDIVLGITWNDWAEGTQLLPTVEDGRREIETLESYGAQFKEIESTPEGLEFPGRLFALRKQSDRYSAVGYDMTILDGLLDEAAMLISNAEYVQAQTKLANAEEIAARYESATYVKHYDLDFSSEHLNPYMPYASGDHYLVSAGWGLNMKLSQQLASELTEKNFDGWLEFEYFDSSNNSWASDSVYRQVFVKGAPARAGFDVICDFYKDDSDQWKKAKVEIFKQNTVFNHSLPYDCDLQIGCKSKSGEDYYTKVRNVRLVFDVYNKGFQGQDVSSFADCWLKNASEGQACREYDFDQSGVVSLSDMAVFSQRWLSLNNLSF